jgi:hypothetical protein
MKGWKTSMLPLTHRSVAIKTHAVSAVVKISMMGAMVKESISAMKSDLKRLTVDTEVNMAFKTKSYILLFFNN